MIELDAARPVQLCNGISRRDFLHAGALGLVGLSLSDLFALKAAGFVRTGRERNCILLMLVGAPSQLDTWDMKPQAPREIRGPYSPIATNVSGIRISEIFPRMARHADKFALLRSVHASGVAVHDAGHQVMQTGRLFPAGLEYPHIGSLVGFLKGAERDMPPHVLLPRPIGHTGGNMPHGQTAGFLGRASDPFVLNADLEDPRVEVPDVQRPPGIRAVRADDRRNLRDLVDGAVKRFESRADARRPSASFDQAYTLISSSRARQAFDLTREPGHVLDRYGRNRFGLSCLLARRLIEAGVRFVTVNMFETVFNETTWDVHGTPPFSSMEAYETLGPMFDHAYASLLEDLHVRGLLDDTLVVATGEFGRTPHLNRAGGRDHWPQCWTVVMAGGGVKGGQVIGASDEIGAYPRERPIPAASIPATVMHALGIDLDTVVPGPAGRPVRLVEPGIEPVAELS